MKNDVDTIERVLSKYGMHDRLTHDCAKEILRELPEVLSLEVKREDPDLEYGQLRHLQTSVVKAVVIVARYNGERWRFTMPGTPDGAYALMERL
jgi:GGDEF domain-containing protein